ncbi:large ribosomal subunit protein uL18m-like isoform X2 [Tigriopus californicus]|uniref:large ribosomal subunit protein uL18m-like isoform X2 n=1 Tax=Tigriopus californicus TaxID=6832 RepID=UPI0027DA8F93|nr:large ribosomal subunit protein uL18m-like isoform X2 [Tigriopus californicus]
MAHVPRCAPESIVNRIGVKQNGSRSLLILGPNDELIRTHVKNRNPRNLEMMRIGYKPSGFKWERKYRQFWNKLELDITHKHTKAQVVHWSGIRVCHASTQEWSIRKFLYNTTDAVALEAIAKVIAQRCLQVGVSHVFLELEEEDLQKERMNRFVDAVKEQGISVGEPHKYRQTEPHVRLYEFKKSIQPWTVIDDEK